MIFQNLDQKSWGAENWSAVLSWQERCKQLQMQMLQKEKETMEKIAAQAFAKRYLADLIPSVFNNLHESGFFYDPIERGLYFIFLIYGVIQKSNHP